MRVCHANLRAAMALGLSVGALLAAGCGDDEEPADSGGSSGSASTQAQAPQAGDQEAGSGVTDFVEYTGGKAGKADASLAPVTIGWVNQQGGPADAGPGATKGAELAVKYINAELGGIGGRPVKLVTCFTSTSEEQGQACGQKMVNDDDVSVVAVGAVAIGSQSLVSTIGGDKPMVNGLTTGGADSTNKAGFSLFGDSLSVSAPFATFAKDVLKAESAAVVYPEIPGISQAGAAMADAAEKAGIANKKVAWSPNATDLVGPLTAAGAQSAEVILTTADPKGCVNLAKAIDQLGLETPVVSQPLCLNAQVGKALGDIPPWTYAIASSLSTDAEDPSAVEFMKVATTYGMAEEAATDVWVPVTFAQILTIAQWMNEVGADAITPESIAEQAKAFEGPLLLGPPTVECGEYPDRPAICNDQAKFYTYEGKGVFKPASGWLGPPS